MGIKLVLASVIGGNSLLQIEFFFEKLLDFLKGRQVRTDNVMLAVLNEGGLALQLVA